MPKMACAAASLLCAVIDSHESQVERRVFSAQFIEGATARLHPLAHAPTLETASATGPRVPVAIM